MGGINNYLGFIVASIILNITPGSDTLYILTRSISQGKKAGVFSVLGISTGILIHTIFAGIGLSAILATSVIAFNIVKYIGVGYLVFLGLKTLLGRKSFMGNTHENYVKSSFKIFSQGVITNVTNPKVALFFISFLPQFININEVTTPLPFLVLGLTFFTTGTLWCLFISFFASALSENLRNNPKIEILLKKISGMVFILLGIKLALVNS